MTSEALREELARLAGDAPVARVDAGTWGRARRARRRERALGVLGAAAAVALVAGLGVVLLPSGDDRAPVASGDRLAVPDHLYAVPSRMAERRDDDSWARSEVSGDLAIGRAAAAWVMDEGLPVVVGAADGAYHLLDLPGYAGNDRLTGLALSGNPALALSPDGRELAYAWGDPGPQDDDRPVPSGVRVVDLETGAVREVPVLGGEGTLVGRIRFSPDGEWIVWSGDRLAAWTQGTVGGETPAIGRIAPGATTSQAVSLGRPALDEGVGPQMAGDLGIDDAGVVVAVVLESVVRWDGEVVGRATLESTGVGAVAVRSDGRRLAVAGGGVTDLGTYDTATGRRDVLTTISGAQPLGFAGDDVVAVTAPDEDGRILLAGPDDTRQVAVVQQAVDETSRTSSLSVAVDLIGPDRLGVRRPEPDWPWSDEVRSAVVGAGVALAVAVLLGLRWGWRRRRAWRAG